MANTITYSKNVIALSAIDSNYLWTETLPSHVNGIPVFTIMFSAGITSANTLVLRDVSLTGPIFLSVTLANDTTQTYPFVGALLSPVMAIADQTFTSGAIWSVCYGHN
jgi:hypothetical protein